MSCSNCTAEFGIFKKEIGCESCGFAFCSRCCKKQEIPVESGKAQKQHVCDKCFMEFTGKAPAVTKGSPPLAHKKRMAEFKKQSFSVDSTAHVRLQSQLSNEKDKELSERLQKLRRDRVKVVLPSEREIEVRLAKLKGMDPSRYNSPPIEVYRPPDKRTSIEQASDLITQITEEVNIDSKIVKPEDEIAARLAALRCDALKQPEEPVTLTTPTEGNSEEMDVESQFSTLQEQSQDLSMAACKEVKELNSNPEYKKLLSSMQHEKETESGDVEEADKLVAQLLASNLHEDLDELESYNSQSSEKYSIPSDKETPVEEFPWCVICTEDAKIRCFGCDQDLYCMRCFKECHDSLDIKDHKTCPYLQTKVPL